MAEEQLSWSFENDEITGEFVHTGHYIRDEIPVPDFICKHKVIFRACKKGYVTYCNKCGKILSVRNRREK